MAISSKKQKNYDEALYYYKKAYDIALDSIVRLNIINNEAVVHIKQKMYNKAKAKLDPIIKLNLLSTDSLLLAKIKGNLAFAKSKLNDANAEKELLGALNLRKRIRDNSGLFANNIHLAEYYLCLLYTSDAADD